MATWPSDLPPFRLPISDQPQDGTLRTSMDTGPAKVRRRFTAVPRNMAIPMRMTGAQYDTLQDFYTSDLSGGALEFDLSDPLTGDTEEFRFLEPPAGSVIVGNADPDKRIWNVQLQLEKLP